MVEHFKAHIYFHGEFTLKGEFYLEVNNCSPFVIFGLTTECPKGGQLPWAAVERLGLTAEPVRVQVTYQTFGYFERPESWYASAKSCRFTQGQKILYEGEVVEGCTGSVYTKTDRLFTSMSFLEEAFRKECRSFIDGLKDEWILL